jgi:hypothetical protein
MRTARRRAKLPSVDKPQTLHVTIELERSSDPPPGRLMVDDATHPFAGWLGLAVALQRAIDGEHQPQADRPSPVVDR